MFHKCILITLLSLLCCWSIHAIQLLSSEQIVQKLNSVHFDSLNEAIKSSPIREVIGNVGEYYSESINSLKQVSYSIPKYGNLNLGDTNQLFSNWLVGSSFSPLDVQLNLLNFQKYFFKSFEIFNQNIGDSEINQLLFVSLPAIPAILLYFILLYKSYQNNNKGYTGRDIDIYQGIDREYNPDDAAVYFNTRPIDCISRSIQIGSTASKFGLSLLFDFLLNKFDENASLRANELTELCTKLGPTFIKVGQSLSIRTDLLSLPYIEALTKLQDRVPAFPVDDAKAIISTELKQPADIMFPTGLDNVVAAASLGQVFKAVLADGTTVAVKVQRPQILEKVALDMHLLRSIAPVVKLLFNVDSNLTGIVDDWGRGFVNELNYVKEAENARNFNDAIKTSPLGAIVFAPEVISDYSTRRVLTTRWIDGVRLDASDRKDIPFLCATCMNTYLYMLLDSTNSPLHCDPHPGNLRVTPDGKLCIMDWGLVTSIPQDLRLDFIDHIAHLTSKDYESVPGDLVKLGFIPAGKESAILEAGVVEVIANVYGQLANGGGAAKIDIPGVLQKLTDLSSTYGNLFQLPPYFAYIARAFGVLEGIGLSSDPDYAILGECLPYISQRLLLDTDTRTGSALETFIFGNQKEKPDRTIDVERVELLIDGFRNYMNVTEGIRAKETKGYSLSYQIENAADKLIELILTKEGSRTPLQRIILEETAKILTASARVQWYNIRQRSGKLPSGRSILGSIVDPLGIFAGSLLVEKNDYDQRILDSTTKLIELLRELANSNSFSTSELLQSLTPRESQQIALLIVKKLWDRRNSIIDLSLGLTRTMIKQTASRIEL